MGATASGRRRTTASNASTNNYGLRSLSKAAGNSEPMLDHSAAMPDPSQTRSMDTNEEPLEDASQMLKEVTNPLVELESTSPLSEVSLSFSLPSPGPLPRRTNNDNTDAEPLESISQILKEVTDPLVEPKSFSPLSEVSLSLPSFSSRSPEPFPLHIEDDDTDTDHNDHLTPSDSISNLDLDAPSQAELHTAAEALRQLQTELCFYGPHTSQQQTSQSYPTLRAPWLLQSTDLSNPFAGDSIRTFPSGVSAFEANQQHSPYFPRAFEANQQHSPYFPRAGLQTQPIVRLYEAQDQYGSSQYGQPQYGRHQYVQAQHLEHSRHPVFPYVLGPFQPQQDTISQDAAAATQSGDTLSAGTTQQHFITTRNLTQTNGSRKRKDSDGANETNTNAKRRRFRSPHVPSSGNDPPSDDPLAPRSDDNLERQAVHIFNTDPWFWSVNDVYFSLTNVHSHDLRHNDNLALPYPHLGLILLRFEIDGPKLLVNLTQAELLGLGITRADHLAATGSLLDKMRLRSATYRLHRNSYQVSPPMLSTKPLGPQTAGSYNDMLNQIRQHLASKPLQNGESRRYHFIFGCFVASLTGPNGQYTLFSNSVSECLDQRRDSLLSQSSHRDSLSLDSVCN